MGNILSIALRRDPPFEDAPEYQLENKTTTTCHLLALPLELRLLIYEDILSSSPTNTTPHILSTCHQIRSEFLKPYLAHLNRIQQELQNDIEYTSLLKTAVDLELDFVSWVREEYVRLINALEELERDQIRMMELNFWLCREKERFAREEQKYLRGSVGVRYEIARWRMKASFLTGRDFGNLACLLGDFSSSSSA